MPVKRTLVLDEDDLIMVVKEDVVHQIDEYRGEMTRTEFTNYLIQSQLKEACKRHDYAEKEDVSRAIQQMKDLIRNLLDFIITLEIAREDREKGFNQFYENLESIGQSAKSE